MRVAGLGMGEVLFKKGIAYARRRDKEEVYAERVNTRRVDDPHAVWT